MSTVNTRMRQLRRLHRRESWRPTERDADGNVIKRGAHAVSFRKWLRARPGVYFGKAAAIAQGAA